MVWRRNAAYALVRVAMGTLFLVNGVLKLRENGAPEFGEDLAQGLSDTLLPEPLVSAFGTILPFLELALGALLLVGLFTSHVLLATGALLIVLTFGTILQAEPDTVAHNVFYTVVVGMLLWLESANAYALDRLRTREQVGSPPRRLEPMPPVPRGPSRRWVAPRPPYTRSRID